MAFSKNQKHPETNALNKSLFFEGFMRVFLLCVCVFFPKESLNLSALKQEFLDEIDQYNVQNR